MRGAHLAQLVIEQHGGMAVDAREFGGRLGRRSSDEMREQCLLGERDRAGCADKS
jgi:hypothetical protein